MTNVNSYDFVIVGSGGSGLFLSLLLSDEFPSLRIAILCKTYPMGSHTVSAKGGINAVLSTIHEDYVEWHTHDTISAGKGLCDTEPTTQMCKNAPDVIRYLSTLGVKFDTTHDGKIDQRIYGGQTTNYGKGGLASRACFVKDHTGHSIMEALTAQVLQRKNITVLPYTHVINLLYNINYSIVYYNLQTGGLDVLKSKYMVFATGGFSQIYHTNSSSHLCTGCGHRILFEYGAKLKDIEMVQFHPTGLENSGMLISEACRSQGAFLRNTEGERFMEKYHHMKELAPRDIVARAIYEESQNGRVYLDLTHIEEHIIKEKLISSYTVAKYFAHVDISKKMLPIYPTAHYNMGGIMVDANYSVSENLYAIGELACASVHGANRLGCNSLLELFTSAKVVFEDISASINSTQYKSNTSTSLDDAVIMSIQKIKYKNCNISYEDIFLYKKQIQQIMDKNASIIKSYSLMKEGLIEINNIYEKIRNLNNCSGISFDSEFVNLYELQSIALMAKCVLEASIFRKHSIGAHFVKDFPEFPENPQHTLMDRKFNISYTDVK